MIPKTLIFDINETLLDMSPVKSVIAEILGDDSLVPLWFNTLLHHSLVENSTGRFHDFIDIGAAALKMVGYAKGKSIALEEAKALLLPVMTNTPAHVDVPAGLFQLKQAGFTLVALSNSGEKGLNNQLRNAKIDHYFDFILSVETIKKYKPDPSVYYWAIEQTQSHLSSTMMVAAHGWDTFGAKSAGLQAAFVQRSGKMEYPLGIQADLSVTNIQALAEHFI